MRILFVGDIVGRSGRSILLGRLPALARDWKLDFVAVNGENAAGGFGITEAIYQEFIDAGVDVVKASRRLGRTRLPQHHAVDLCAPVQGQRRQDPRRY